MSLKSIASMWCSILNLFSTAVFTLSPKDTQKIEHTMKHKINALVPFGDMQYPFKALNHFT